MAFRYLSPSLAQHVLDIQGAVMRPSVIPKKYRS